jgi:hypothetical protein
MELMKNFYQCLLRGTATPPWLRKITPGRREEVRPVSRPIFRTEFERVPSIDLCGGTPGYSHCSYSPRDLACHHPRLRRLRRCRPGRNVSRRRRSHDYRGAHSLQPSPNRCQLGPPLMVGAGEQLIANLIRNPGFELIGLCGIFFIMRSILGDDQ